MDALCNASTKPSREPNLRCGNARAIMAEANVPDNCKNILLPYAVKLVWNTSSLKIITIGNKTASRFEHLCGNQPKFIKYMHRFGKAGTLKDAPVNAPKSRELGLTGIFVSYAINSSGDCMMMLDPNNKFQRYHTCDVTFLKRQYYSRDPNVSRNGRVLTIEGLD